MSYILHISTAVPEHRVEKESLLRFYAKAFAVTETDPFLKKVSFLLRKTKIDARYSCVSDYNGDQSELFTDGNYGQSLEKRMALYRDKIVPLSCKAIDALFHSTTVIPADVTHLIAVSCTGMFAPGLEFMIAGHYDLQHTEKSALNFLGCYAALKAMKQAHYIAQSNPDACILVVCAELCSLHFHPSREDEDLIANLLFADGASALFICGEKNKHARGKTVLKINGIASAFIPGTADLMTWQLSSSAFRMHLSPRVVDAVRAHIQKAAGDFIGEAMADTDYWAIHPGGLKIIEAVRESLGLSMDDTTDSMQVLKEYGNMSSPTILFVLRRIFDRIQMKDSVPDRKIFACAFGPGLNIEMIRLSSAYITPVNETKHIAPHHAVQV
ncbi:MAG TPA: type III polyketide synthase [Bacteroidia bacterium]|jgi:predicted naringenin-chalcone synthase|nr:type III polyketide synthase [Bacteroidia bacterium]